MSCVGMPCYEDGFRLAGPASECSLRSKARIDALFEDSRSIYGSTMGGWYGGVSTVGSNHLGEMGADEQRRVNSSVQARIEAMFASVEAESGTPDECAAAILPVKYMGAAPVGGRVASVRGLQEPLRQLLKRAVGTVKADLEVSRRGLTFRTADGSEKNNPFRRIAVWSALRLRSKRTPSGELHHAFLPLVGDYEQGQTGEEKHADLYRTMHGLEPTASHYPPIFAVVMRQAGANKLLECHAFSCDSEEDAVAAAATLYRALLADLDANRRRPRHTNGVGCVSLASIASSVREPSPIGGISSRIKVLQAEAARSNPSHPVRPPRTKKTSVSSSVTEDEAGKHAELVKAPRRKKKNSDVKAEDILEARGKRTEASPKGKVSPGVQSLGSIRKNFDSRISKEEERQNSKNRALTGEKETSVLENIETSDSRGQSGKIYDVGANGFYETVSNRYEKLPVRAAGSIGEGKQSPAREPENEKIYEKSRGSYDLNPSARDHARSREIYWSRSDAVVYDRIEKQGKSEENLLYERAVKGGSKERLYEDRAKDADKIYSVARDEIYGGRSSKLGMDAPRSSRENIPFAKTGRGELYQSSPQEGCGDSVSAGRRRSRDQEKPTSGKRVSRVVTMDKPLKKQFSDSTTNLNVPEYTQSRVRKRSRAGSEPPVSRSEDAISVLQETRLKRSQSDIDVDRGDLMTRVELPRRGSFLNPRSARRPNSVKGGTPLGFTELFDEFRNQEGLTSVDDILAAIIDPEGMSFNDLKPLYKEFLLKLAATLTQDELYQRSASIMKKRRRPQRRRSSRRSCLIGRAIKRSVSRLKGGPTEFTSVIFPARRLNDSFGSSSSCDARNNHRNRVLANKLGKRRPSWRTRKTAGVCQTTSEDSDTCRRLGRGMVATANRSSSGYVSCSECSYDSESCTCVSADKCYCSLSKRVPTQPQVPPNTIVCACDTDSCSESNKCYCARQPARSTILEQLRQRGIVPSESTLSRTGSPERGRATKTARSRTPSESLNVLKKPSSSSYSSSNNLALDYDLFNPGRKSQQSSDSEKVLVVSARDTQGRLVYVGGADRNKKCLSHCSSRSGGHHEALSIKKSAEIAAIFGADSSRISRRTSNASSIRSSISLEAGLGYLP